MPFTNAAPLLERATAELAPGEMVMASGISLMELMSAVEVMDPRTDVYSKNRQAAEDARQAEGSSADENDDVYSLSPRELLWIVDHIRCREAQFLNGEAIPATLLGVPYLYPEVMQELAAREGGPERADALTGTLSALNAAPSAPAHTSVSNASTRFSHPRERFPKVVEKREAGLPVAAFPPHLASPQQPIISLLLTFSMLCIATTRYAWSEICQGYVYEHEDVHLATLNMSFEDWVCSGVAPGEVVDDIDSWVLLRARALLQWLESDAAFDFFAREGDAMYEFDPACEYGPGLSTDIYGAPLSVDGKGGPAIEASGTTAPHPIASVRLALFSRLKSRIACFEIFSSLADPVSHLPESSLLETLFTTVRYSERCILRREGNVIASDEPYTGPAVVGRGDFTRVGFSLRLQRVVSAHRERTYHLELNMTLTHRPRPALRAFFTPGDARAPTLPSLNAQQPYFVIPIPTYFDASTSHTGCLRGVFGALWLRRRWQDRIYYPGKRPLFQVQKLWAGIVLYLKHAGRRGVAAYAQSLHQALFARSGRFLTVAPFEDLAQSYLFMEVGLRPEVIDVLKSTARPNAPDSPPSRSAEGTAPGTAREAARRCLGIANRIGLLLTNWMPLLIQNRPRSRRSRINYLKEQFRSLSGEVDLFASYLPLIAQAFLGDASFVVHPELFKMAMDSFARSEAAEILKMGFEIDLYDVSGSGTAVSGGRALTDSDFMRAAWATERLMLYSATTHEQIIVIEAIALGHTDVAAFAGDTNIVRSFMAYLNKKLEGKNFNNLCSNMDQGGASDGDSAFGGSELSDGSYEASTTDSRRHPPDGTFSFEDSAAAYNKHIMPGYVIARVVNALQDRLSAALAQFSFWMGLISLRVSRPSKHTSPFALAVAPDPSLTADLFSAQWELRFGWLKECDHGLHRPLQSSAYLSALQGAEDECFEAILDKCTAVLKLARSLLLAYSSFPSLLYAMYVAPEQSLRFTALQNDTISTYMVLVQRMRNMLAEEAKFTLIYTPQPSSVFPLWEIEEE